MRKQIKAALIGMVLAAVLFLATPTQAACNGDCPDGWSSLDYMFIFLGCEYSVVDGQLWVRCDYIPFKMGNTLPQGMQICESPGQAPKPSELVDNRNDAVKSLRSDSR